jgi:hypothetical protein
MSVDNITTLLRRWLTHLDQQADRFEGRAIDPADKGPLSDTEDQADDNADVRSLRVTHGS